MCYGLPERFLLVVFLGYFWTYLWLQLLHLCLKSFSRSDWALIKQMPDTSYQVTTQ